ncbi:MAG: ribonuclease H family protein [Bacteroides sp.]|nr:ribonuclease H family protein [Bacteroides sp.]
MAKKKYYVVWAGVNPGIYQSWDECQLQTAGYAGAKYKSFDSLAEAEDAYAASPYDYMGSSQGGSKRTASAAAPHSLPAAVIANSLAVDAACSGNPGPMEYRGVHVGSGQEVFRVGPLQGTNNIGEFLALVHGLALMKQKGLDLPIYSDSVNAMGWVKKKQCKTKLERNANNAKVFELIARAEQWLKENTYNTRLIKWDTRSWGEIPADFGRK